MSKALFFEIFFMAGFLLIITPTVYAQDNLEIVHLSQAIDDIQRETADSDISFSSTFYDQADRSSSRSDFGERYVEVQPESWHNHHDQMATSNGNSNPDVDC